MGLSVTHLLVVLAIAVVVFGTKRLRNIGADLGGAIKGFRTAMKEGDDGTDAGGRATHGAVVEKDKSAEDKGEAIEGEVTAKKTGKD